LTSFCETQYKSRASRDIHILAPKLSTSSTHMMVVLPCAVETTAAPFSVGS